MTSTAPSPADYVAHPPRIADAHRVSPDNYRAMLALARSVQLDATLRELLNIRVSQLNGCAYCLDLHIHAARENGEATQRLDTLAGWRESPFFTAAERAALGLAEAMTRLTDGPVPDAVYDEAARHFEQETLAQVIFAITVINAWNRVAVTVQTQPAAR